MAKNGSIRNTRKDFEREFNILAELIIEKKIHFSSAANQTVTALKKLRQLSNNRLNLTTINESARATAMMARNKHMMEKEAEKAELVKNKYINETK